MKILCFAPNDAVWRWTLPQAQFLETLRQRGDSIDYLYCDRTFATFCMAMASSGVGVDAGREAKEAICARCVNMSGLVREQFGFSGHPVHRFLTDKEKNRASDIAGCASIKEMTDYQFDGIPIGKFALYEAIIQTKSISMDFSPRAERLYRLLFENCVLTAYAVRRAIEELTPNVGISYHTAYSYNRTFQHLAEARGCPVWFLNASFSAAELDSHLVAARSDPELLFKRMLSDWDRFKDVPSSSAQLHAATDHLLSLMEGGGFAYSTAMKPRRKKAVEQLGCPAGKKVLLAALSSYDELFASDVSGFGWSVQSPVFADQIDWVRWLFDFARMRPDVHIVVRVHPREFPIRNVGPRSEHALMLEKVFAERPVNVSINLPSDGISLYELLAGTDVVLIAWSSAGLEAGMLGIPVVTWFGNAMLFPSSLTFEAKSRTEYGAMVEAALASPWLLERARLFYRWAVMMLVRTRVDMTNGRAPSVRALRAGRFVRRGFNYLRRRFTPWTDEQWSIMRRPKNLNDAPAIHALLDRQLPVFYDCETAKRAPEEEETAGLKRELAAIAHAVRKTTGHRADRLEAMLSIVKAESVGEAVKEGSMYVSR
ncbi:MAG TPA: hypothetical protein VFB29_00840 [Pseudolabrys sp.]|nr:hypothetical protein [Pseudolabrys sp.]